MDGYIWNSEVVSRSSASRHRSTMDCGQRGAGSAMYAFCVQFPTYPWLPSVRGQQPRHWATCVLRLNCSLPSIPLSSDPQLAHVVSLSTDFSITTPLRHHMRRNVNKVRKTEALVSVTRMCVISSSAHCSRQRRQRKKKKDGFRRPFRSCEPPK